MKVRRWALVTPLLFLLAGPAWADDIRPAMESINARFLAAFNTPDTTAFPALYTEDAILIFHGALPIVGPEAIKRFWESRISAGARDHTFESLKRGLMASSLIS
jgi:ketosteroid isomerase-like protein